MAVPRHSWGAPDRFPNKTERVCVHCGVVRVTRHEGVRHWTEFWRGLERVASDGHGWRTPACERGEEGADAA